MTEDQSSPARQISRDRSVVFRIGDAELDAAQRQIRFGGKTADVQPKVFDLIEYLIRARDRVVSKDELFDEIWPNVVVSESSLTQTIKRARDLFREHGFDTDVIRTVARKGYQFDHDVEADTSARASPTTPTKWKLAAAVAASVAVVGLAVWSFTSRSPSPPSQVDASIAVLPFANLSSDEEFGYFSDGLSETLTVSLTAVQGLRVVARGSAFSFRNTDADYATIGDALNVAHVVEGNVQRSGDELRITARLVRVADGTQIWSRVYNRLFDDIFAIQDDISRSIVGSMDEILAADLALTGGAEMLNTSAADAEAYRLLLKGRDLRKNASTDGLRAAEDNFRAALALQPDYPEAIVALADVIRVRAVLGDLPREQSFSQALALIRRALELRPEFPDAYLQLGEIQHRHFWNFDDAQDSFARALRLNPGSAGVRAAYSRFLSKTGEFQRAVDEAWIARDLNPRSARAGTSLVIRLTKADQLGAAREVLDAISTQHPKHADLPWLETNWHIRNESYGNALEWIAQEELDYLRLSLSAVALRYLGRNEQAREVLEKLIATDEGAAFQIAETYAHWNEADEAFAWLERAFSAGDPGLAELYSSLNLENLYGDPRFAQFAARVGLPPLP